LKGKGVVLNEPSVVAVVDNKGRSIVIHKVSITWAGIAPA
jgi:actin-like ATPase involved in cell morphogenesis